MAKSTKNGRGKLVSQVYEALKRRVITLELKPGEFLNEKRLMEEMKVGRTPLRESILRLKAESLVEGEPNKSSYVKDISLQGTKDLVEALIIVEKNVAFLAAQRITPQELEEVKRAERRVQEAIEANDSWRINTENFEFHEAISRGCGNRILYQLHQNLRNQAQRLSYLAIDYRATSVTSLSDHYEKILFQHREMVELLEAHRAPEIEAVCVAHLELFKSRILSYLSDTSYL